MIRDLCPLFILAYSSDPDEIPHTVSKIEKG